MQRIYANRYTKTMCFQCNRNLHELTKSSILILTNMRWKIFIIYCVLMVSLLFNLQSSLSSETKASISQKQINEMAALFLQVRRDILENGRIRKPGETVPAYCQKIAKPLQAETNEFYLLRLSFYDKSLNRLIDKKLDFSNRPKLIDTSPENVVIWDHMCRQLKYLPARLRKVHQAIEFAKKKNSDLIANELSKQLLVTIQFNIGIYDLLRDAHS